MGKLFGTDGIRGVANRHPMDAAMALAVGQAVTYVLRRPDRQPRVIVGKDTRISGYMLESALEAGITSMGGVAEMVGRQLRALGRERQVLCVTHLPQVAAQADRQWSVSKFGVEGRVKTMVSVLDQKGRIEEVARMLGGTEITATTRKHAAEMLSLR